MEPIESGEITVLRTSSIQTCRDIELLLTAIDIPSRLVRENNEVLIYVSVDDLPRARAEINTYASENDIVPAVTQPTALNPPSYVAMMLFAAAIWFTAGIAELLNSNWYAAGRIDGNAIRAGEWPRLVTALFLHGDLAHIISNTGFGMAVLYFSSRVLGPGLALFSALAAGAAGNAINVMLQPANHLSLGASTAIFAVLGMLGVFGWLARVQPQHRLASRIGPLIAAVAILAYTGAGGERTDVGAHLWGFAVGAIIGAPLWQLRRGLGRRGIQQGLGAVTAIIMIGCWTLVLRH